MNKNQFLKDFFSKKMLILFFMGFSSGLPLLLVGGTLKIWLTREGVDISAIGYFSWVSIFYSMKFVWAPFLDRYSYLRFGRRRSWMLLSQMALALLIAYMGFFDPRTSLMTMAIMALLIAFFSSIQDVAIEAYRREYLRDEELGLGSSVSIYGYRVAMLLAGGVGIGLVSDTGGLTWQQLYSLMGAAMFIGIATTLVAPEPSMNQKEIPKSLLSSIVEPFREFLNRKGAWFVLFFVFAFKLGDALSGSLLNPFYVQMGYSNEVIGLVAKTIGMSSSLIGLFLGGVVIYRFNIYKSLWFFGILQALSTAGFALITYTGPQIWALSLAVIFEDVSAGMGTAAFVAYISSVTDKRYTATQFALLSSLAGLGRNFFSGFTGDMVKAMGWAPFFYFCSLVAIPGLILLYFIQRQKQQA